MKKWNRRVLLALVMMFVLLPAAAWAADAEETVSPELAAAGERLATAQAEYDHWANIKDEMDATNAAAQEAITYWTEQVKVAEVERKDAQAMLRTCTTEKKDLQAQLRALTSEENTLSRQLKLKKLSDAELTRYEEMNAQVAQMDELSAALAENSVVVANAAEQAGTLAVTIEQLRYTQSQYEEDSADWLAIQVEIDDLAADKARWEATKDDAKAQANALDSQIKTLQAAIKKDSKQLAKLTERQLAVETLQQKLSDCQAKQVTIQEQLDIAIAAEAEAALRAADTEKLDTAKANLALAKKNLSQMAEYKAITQNFYAAKAELAAAQALYDALV